MKKKIFNGFVLLQLMWISKEIKILLHYSWDKSRKILHFHLVYENAFENNDETK